MTMEQNIELQPEPKKQSLAIPAAILLGFAMIAAAIYFSNQGGNTVVTAPTNNTTGEEQQNGDLSAINPVTEDDHIRGNPNAPIMLVEYSDYDCPFCKNFHETMNQIMEDYGLSGQVAWVYRHFPLEQLHPNAPRIALASECVAELGGDDAFWTFSDLVFEERSTNEPTDMTRLSEFASSAGVSEADFTACLESERHKDKVEEDFNNAIAVGGRGTPHTVVLVGDQQGVINGAQPYSVVKQIVENLITQLEGGEVEQI